MPLTFKDSNASNFAQGLFNAASPFIILLFVSDRILSSCVHLKWGKCLTILVLVSFIIAGPLSYYIMTQYWLRNFAYRIDIDILMILGAGLVSIVIAWLTVSYQSFKTAASNPVDYLKSD